MMVLWKEQWLVARLQLKNDADEGAAAGFMKEAAGGEGAVGGKVTDCSREEEEEEDDDDDDDDTVGDETVAF